MPSVGTTTLLEKLQIKDGERIALLGPPEGMEGIVGDARTGTVVHLGAEPGGRYDTVIAFAAAKAALDVVAPAAFSAVRPGGKLWFCYPKIASGVKTDLTRDVGWQVVEEAGWRGVRQISVDDTWSGLRFRPSAEVGT